MQTVESQQSAFEEIYHSDKSSKFRFHIVTDPLIRYIRDRRLNVAMRYLSERYPVEELKKWSVLIVCGGVGGEGIYFQRKGIENVTISDISLNSLKIAKSFSPTFKTIQLNAEAIDLPDESFDLVVVQDGLHHLPRPVLGFTEMLRVASKAIVVIEPYNSAVGNLIGTEWEKEGEFINYVFRWDRKLVNQVTKSYLLKKHGVIKVFRLWDHGGVIKKIVHKFPASLRLRLAKLIYATLSIFDGLGNNTVVVVDKRGK